MRNSVGEASEATTQFLYHARADVGCLYLGVHFVLDCSRQVHRSKGRGDMPVSAMSRRGRAIQEGYRRTVQLQSCLLSCPFP